MKERKITADMISRMSKQSLKASRMRNFFVMATIVLAASLLMAILMFAMGQDKRFKQELSHRHQAFYYSLTDTQVEKLKEDTHISYQIQVKEGVLTSMDGFDVAPYYVSSLSDEIRVGELLSGEMPKDGQEIALQEALLYKMGVSPVLGSEVTFEFYDGNTETFTVSGILKGGETDKQFRVFFSENYAKCGSQLKDIPYAVYVKLNNADQMYPQEFKELIYQIGTDAGIARKFISPSKAFEDSLSIDLQSVLVYGLVGTVILVACILVVYGVFYLSVIGRIHQFGQLWTIGMTRKQMKKLVSHEGRLLFFKAAPIGIAAGGIFGYGIIPDGFDFLHMLFAAALVFAVVYGITMISVHKPARAASRVSPMEALRYLPQDTIKRKENRKQCRKLSPVALGILNFSKNKRKAAVTMLSLALGGILFMTAATYMSSFDKGNYARQGYFKDAEFHITYSVSAIELDENGLNGLQAHMPLDQKMVREISAIDGVERVTERKSFGCKFDFPAQNEYGLTDEVYPLTKQELGELEGYLEEGSADKEKLMSGNYILTGENAVVQEVCGWKFHPGDKVTIHFYDGNAPAEKEVTILGILNAQFNLDKGMDGWFLMPEQVILNMVSFDNINAHLLVSTEPEKEDAVGESLSEIIENKPQLIMETLKERTIAYKKNADQQFGMISGLAVFIMAFSILSMMNTLITNIVTRKQELAMLESIGMGKGQMKKMLLGESLLLALTAVGVTMTAGTLCGYILSGMLYHIGAFYMKFQFPVVFAVLYTAVLVLVPLVITAASMHSFSKEALVERLRGAEY